MTEPSLMRAVCDLECIDCGLTIRTGDDVVLGTFGWVHPCCGLLEAAVDA